ncbi:MAG: ribosome maturation factor RimM [Anaerolineae bacterium]
MRSKQPEPRYLAVGRVLRPHGIRGELKIEVLTDYPERLVELDKVYIGESYQPHEVVSARPHKKAVLLKLKEYQDRNAAEELRDELVYVAIEDAIPLEEDEYYEYQVEGLEVITDEGDLLGEVVDVLTVPRGHDVLVVHGPVGETLIPMIEDIVVELDLDAGRMVIHPLPGLLNGLD